MRILFLDIDGVLNNSAQFTGINNLDDDNVAQLNRIIAATDCQIVISSDWRHSHKKHELEQFLIRQGADVEGRILDMTSYLPDHGRGHEIWWWLRTNLDWKRWAAVDDNIGEIVNVLTETCVFETSPKTGLTEDVANQIIKHLTSP